MILSSTSPLAEGVASQNKVWSAEKNAGNGFVYPDDFSEKMPEDLLKTAIYRSDTSPTGYYVTFRYHAPNATRIRIRGEWSFATDRGSFFPMSDNIMPEDYRDGMFPLQVDQKDWPTFDMKRNPETGCWEYTVALPSGTWSYRFIVGGVEGAAPDDCTDAFVETDPNNRPLEKKPGEQNNSQVRVPFDGSRQSLDMSVQLPRRDQQIGSLTYHLYEAEEIADKLQDTPAIAVYTPYNYDPHRTEPYKVLYLSHGIGMESEMSWWNKGSVGNMMDNLIAENKVDPFVLVLINNYAVSFDPENLPQNIIPLVEANYNVCTTPSGKALAGLSMGGLYTVRQMLNHPEAFGFYGIFSGGFFRDAAAKDIVFDAAALKDSKIYLSAGSKEFGLLAVQRVSAVLSASGVKGYHSCVITGGHDWNVWRQIFVDFVTKELWK